MTDINEAPERIWACGCDGSEGYYYDDQAECDSECMSHTVEYIRADLAKPKVKPLVWLGGGRRYHSSEGEFAIERLDVNRREVWQLLQADLGTQYRGNFGGHGGLARAKDVAETIHRRRILSALEGE